jgi:hypothetical protein
LTKEENQKKNTVLKIKGMPRAQYLDISKTNCLNDNLKTVYEEIR